MLPPPVWCDGLGDTTSPNGVALGNAYRGAIYSVARLQLNQTYLNDVWLFRLPQLPWQPRVRSDGAPRYDAGTSLPH